MKLKSKPMQQTKEVLCLPGESMTVESIVKTIEMAEKGPFYNSMEFKAKFSDWKKDYLK